jgi:hypothetical protein
LFDHLLRVLRVAIKSQYTSVGPLGGDLHFGVDLPLEVFLTLIRSTRSSLYSTEKLRAPIDAFAVTLCCFCSLHLFNLCLRVGCHVLISRFDCFGDVVP